MPGPARAGALIYAKDLERLSTFYRDLLGANTRVADAEHQVLESTDVQLIIHAIPPAFAAGITIETPPVPREEQAIKLFFTLDCPLAEAEQRITTAGGRVFGAVYPGPGFRTRNACDCEGNIFHLRVTGSA